MIRRSAVFLFTFSMVVFAQPPLLTGLRMPSEPYISGDGFRSMADQVFDETDASLLPQEIRYGDIVFVKTDMLGKFFLEIHPHIHAAYIIISHNSDGQAPAEFEAYLEDPKILRWFAQNPTISHHDKFEPVPIGINNRYVSDTGNVQNFFSLLEYRQKNAIVKTCLLGINFRVRTNKDLRQAVFDLFVNRPYCRQLFVESHDEYLKMMTHAKFILCPQGNGLDCHRTWEAIIAGSIPILVSSFLDELLQGLAVLVVQNWELVDEQFLNNVYDSINAGIKNSVTEKITYDYWYRRIKGFQERCRAEV